MRIVLSLTLFLLFSVHAIAKTDNPRMDHNKVVVVEMSISAVSIDKGLSMVQNIELAILYKMKENIIRRELSFIPRKKWMKWV